MAFMSMEREKDDSFLLLSTLKSSHYFFPHPYVKEMMILKEHALNELKGTHSVVDEAIMPTFLYVYSPFFRYVYICIYIYTYISFLSTSTVHV